MSTIARHPPPISGGFPGPTPMHFRKADFSPAPGNDVETIRTFYERDLPRLVLEISGDPTLRQSWPAYDALIVYEEQDHDTSWHAEIDPSFVGTSGWRHIYQHLLKDGRKASTRGLLSSRPVPAIPLRQPLLSVTF